MGMRQRITAWWSRIRQNEAQLSLALSLIVGAVVGLVVVAFIVLTGRVAVRMYPPGGAAWRRVLVPTLGSLVTGFLLFRYFPFARGSGIPQTKYALFVEDGRITLRTVIGKFLSAARPGQPEFSLGARRTLTVQTGIASVISRRLGNEPVSGEIAGGIGKRRGAGWQRSILPLPLCCSRAGGDYRRSARAGYWDRS